MTHHCRAGRRLTFATLALMTVASAIDAQPLPPVALPPDATTVVRLRLQPYDDQPRSVAQVRAIATAVPPRTIVVAPGDTISALLVREYGFGMSDLPITYQLLEARVLELNNLERPEQVRPGPLLIPALPSKTNFNAANVLNAVAASASFDMVASSVSSSGGFVSERKVDTTRLGAIATVADFYLPQQAVRPADLAELVKAELATFPGEPMAIDFFADGNCDRKLNPPLVAPGDGTLIRSQLQSHRRVVPMFVLDTGWPSAAQAAAAIQYLNGMLTEIRTALGVPFTPLALPAFRPPSLNHAVRVSDAVAELAALDQGKVVPVVFVPLSKEQGAEPLLRELIFTADLLGRTGLPKPGAPIHPAPTDAITAARDFAESRLRQIPPAITGRVSITEKAIVESVVHLATASASLRRSRFVVSASWILNQGVLSYAAPLTINGIVVVAAGNFGVNVIQDDVDFARRAASSAEFITVVNMSESGDLVCNSSTVGTSSLDQINAVGLHGDVIDGSATSFSTPRVAWLLALAEAARTTEVAPNLWATEFKQRIIKSRPNADRLLTTPARLLALWQ